MENSHEGVIQAQGMTVAFFCSLENKEVVDSKNQEVPELLSP